MSKSWESKQIQKHRNMVGSNNILDEFLGCEIKKIDFIRNEDYASTDKERFVDQVSIHVCEKIIQINPLVDTAEVEVKVVECYDTKGEELFSNYKGMKLNYTWLGINTNGYIDVFMIALEQLIPNILILNEGAVLTLFTIEPLGECSLPVKLN